METKKMISFEGTSSLKEALRIEAFKKGDIYGFMYRLKASYARNYGNDNTSREILSTNTALLLDIHKHVEKAWGLDFGVRLAADLGSQWGNQFGAQITITKRGIITRW